LITQDADIGIERAEMIFSRRDASFSSAVVRSAML
jgi:hypothetical protein